MLVPAPMQKQNVKASDDKKNGDLSFNKSNNHDDNSLSNINSNHHSPSIKNDNPSLLQLQQQIGNQSVQRLLRSGRIQTKLQVSQPGDEYEKEADRVAEQVMRMPSSEEPFLQTKIPDNEKINRKCKSCEEEEDKESKKIPISRKENGNSSDLLNISDGASKDIDSTLSQSGSPLDSSTREFMEPRFGYDFGNVRIHTDEQSSISAQKVNALAYTVGNNIVFNKNRYEPNLREGKKLLAHELTHVLQQQRSGSFKNVLRRESAEDIKSRYTNWGGLNLQEEALALYLVAKARAGNYQTIIDVINILDSSDRDDVAGEMMIHFSKHELITMARDANAVTMLRQMKNEIGSGWETKTEIGQSDLLGAVINEPGARDSWNRARIKVIKDEAKNDLDALATIFEDDQIIDDASISGRLQSILGATEHIVIPGLQTGIDFKDTGFAGEENPTGGGPGFRDPYPSSSNQVGHFLTAVGLQFNPTVVSKPIPLFGSIRGMVEAPAGMTDAEVALRLTIGHEKAPDPSGAVEIFVSIAATGVIERLLPGPEGETKEQRNDRVAKSIEAETKRQIAQVISAFKTQFESVTEADISSWNEAVTALGTGNTLDIKNAETPLRRIPIDYANKGNSIQDLRLSLVGWRLGQLIGEGKFSNGIEIAQWIRTNLGKP